MDRRSLRSRRTEDIASSAAAAPPTTQSAAAAAATQTRRGNAGIRTRASPSLNKVPPAEPPVADVGLRARRSSRPRSAAGQPVAAPRTTATRSTAKAPTPIQEVNEVGAGFYISSVYI